ncbi:MAG: hypothetical protein U1D30_01805 [Planctomycetota bacterium]
MEERGADVTSDSCQEATVEIHILRDGRLFLFGLSEPVLEVVSELTPDGHPLRRRLPVSPPGSEVEKNE